jgi:hypothetical protein
MIMSENRFSRVPDHAPTNAQSFVDPPHPRIAPRPRIGSGHGGCIAAELANVTLGLAIPPVRTHQDVTLLQ